MIRSKRVRTTISDKAAPSPLVHVIRQFQAPRPNALWVSDFTYAATWSDFVYVAFVIDAYARRIVGWRVSRTGHADFALHALEQALHERRPVPGGGLAHHSDRGNTCRSEIPSGWQTPPSNPQSVAPATPLTTHSPRRSTTSTKRRSSIGADAGSRSRGSSSQPLNGSTGSITDACWSLSATFRRPKSRPATMPYWKNRLWRRHSKKLTSEEPGRNQPSFPSVYGCAGIWCSSKAGSPLKADKVAIVCKKWRGDDGQLIPWNFEFARRVRANKAPPPTSAPRDCSISFRIESSFRWRHYPN